MIEGPPYTVRAGEADHREHGTDKQIVMRRQAHAEPGQHGDLRSDRQPIADRDVRHGLKRRAAPSLPHEKYAKMLYFPRIMVKMT